MKSKTKAKKSSSHYDAIFVGIFDGDQSKRQRLERFDFISRKIALIVHIKTYGSGVWAVLF